MELIIIIIHLFTQLGFSTPPSSARAHEELGTSAIAGTIDDANIDRNGTGRLGEVHFVR